MSPQAQDNNNPFSGNPAPGGNPSSSPTLPPASAQPGQSQAMQSQAMQSLESLVASSNQTEADCTLAANVNIEKMSISDANVVGNWQPGLGIGSIDGMRAYFTNTGCAKIINPRYSLYIFLGSSMLYERENQTSPVFDKVFSQGDFAAGTLYAYVGNTVNTFSINSTGTYTEYLVLRDKDTNAILGAVKSQSTM